MKRRNLANLLAALLIAACSSTALAASGGTDEDTDTRFVNAKVVEVTDSRISVVARSGVEHVIAIDGSNTRVLIEGERVSLKDVRQGDVVTVELDEQNPVKFARNISVTAQPGTEVARAKP